MTHSFSRAFQYPLRIREFAATDETKIDVISNYSDVANAVLHPVGRAVKKRNDVHLDDVLAARRQFFEDQLPQRDRQFLNSPFVWFEQIQKLFGRLRHA